MTTKETTTEVSLEKKARGLWALGNEMGTEILNFIRYAERADTIHPSKTYTELAENSLAHIEDAIKRYREGRPQSYEEKPKD